MAVGTFMLLIVEGGDAERDTAASEPKSEYAAKQANKPCKSSFVFIYVSHSHLSTGVASNLNWMFRPDLRIAWMAMVPSSSIVNHNDLRLRWSHDVLNWLTIRSNLYGHLLHWSCNWIRSLSCWSWIGLWLWSIRLRLSVLHLHGLLHVW